MATEPDQLTATSQSPAKRAPLKVKVEQLSMDFPAPSRSRSGPTRALEAVDLEVPRGQFYTLVGPSGCGKTTLLHIIGNLARQTSGAVTLYPEPDAASAERTRPLTAMVFQEQSIFPWMTVRDNIAFGLKARRIPRAERHHIALSYIEKIGLRGFEHALPHQLSGGMKQRVSVARAFANDPDILLMDEPFAALDEQTRMVLQEELLRVWDETKKTVLFVTHSIDEAIVLSDQIVVMSAHPGRIKQIIPVCFPRPRRIEEIRAEAAFGELFATIWRLLREEVQGI